MSKTQQIIEHIVVTFFEGVISYLSINQTNLSGNAKTVSIGAVAFGLSAVYNLLRQSQPSLVSPPPSPKTPDPIMNGVTQITSTSTGQLPIINGSAPVNGSSNSSPTDPSVPSVS